jgi:hypothetical protein
LLAAEDLAIAGRQICNSSEIINQKAQRVLEINPSNLHFLLKYGVFLKRIMHHDMSARDIFGRFVL